MRGIDYKRRKAFALYESRRKALQAVATNQNLEVSLRWWAQLEKSKLPRQSSLSRVHNHCVDTNRSRSVLSFYKLSRLQFRRLASKGSFSGLRKACW
uniref:ribosomal protein S14 n=1 Tax=Alaria marginata TaxID=98221 RepID=UPI001D0FF267|nr:ribosomal protein S14 [Alaria marginata]UAX19725.1 ribosomal protein S14 [Alaria marginata]UAX19763.1 ribosomal protein S14 [Alaria marginata]UAX19801.1 ribosomal protein S14 [Alaria marginata]UAX19991.1 ribosomal protein S14 [Alaria marginata]UAX20143.1 ribosomal protein S14 [Alaria marginata]